MVSSCLATRPLGGACGAACEPQPAAAAAFLGRPDDPAFRGEPPHPHPRPPHNARTPLGAATLPTVASHPDMLVSWLVGVAVEGERAGMECLALTAQLQCLPPRPAPLRPQLCLHDAFLTGASKVGGTPGTSMQHQQHNKATTQVAASPALAIALPPCCRPTATQT